MLYTPSPIDPKAPPVRINLLSDTQTKPTPAMREAMARAEVGDEQVGDDPTVNALCARVAELLGKEAAVYMPSGTMCNVTATLVHCRPGDEILAHESAHIIAREGGAHAAIGGFQVTQLKGADGQFTPETFRKALHPRTRYQPPQTVVSVEQTANIGGGTIWKKAALARPRTVADRRCRGAGARDQPGILQARRRRHRRRQDGRGAAPARRHACDDGRPHSRLHPSRRHGGPDRGDHRLYPRDRARGMTLGSPATRTRSASYRLIDQRLQRQLNPAALRRGLHHE